LLDAQAFFFYYKPFKSQKCHHLVRPTFNQPPYQQQLIILPSFFIWAHQPHHDHQLPFVLILLASPYAQLAHLISTKGASRLILPLC